MIAVHLKNMNEEAFEIRYSLCLSLLPFITIVDLARGPHNAPVPVLQVGNSPSFAGVNFISPSMTQNMPHINHTSLGCGQK